MSVICAICPPGETYRAMHEPGSVGMSYRHDAPSPLPKHQDKTPDLPFVQKVLQLSSFPHVLESSKSNFLQQIATRLTHSVQITRPFVDAA